MKIMTCQQLGGACDMAFRGNSFEEIAGQSKKHGMEMFQQGDKAHLEAMQAMKPIMSSPEKMQAWLEEKKNLFDAIADNG